MNSKKNKLPPFAKYTIDKQLQCMICSDLIKNEILWEKHMKSERHISGLKFLKENIRNQKTIKKIEVNVEEEIIPPEPVVVEELIQDNNKIKEKFKILLKNENLNIPMDFFDNSSNVKENLPDTNKQESDPTPIKIEIKEELSDSSSDINEEIETMIECTIFLKNLIDKKKSDNKYEHILQDNVELQKFTQKKRKLNYSEDNIDDIFETNWRNKY